MQKEAESSICKAVAQPQRSVFKLLEARELELNRFTSLRQSIKYRTHAAAAVDARSLQQTDFIKEASRKKARIDRTAANDSKTLDAEFLEQNFASAGKIDSLLAADNLGNSFAVEVFDISLLHLFTTDHDERLVIDHRGFPKKRSARVDNDAVGAFGLFGKTLAIESIGAIGLKFALISKLELRSNAAAQASVGIEFAKRGVVLIDAAQLGGHAAVDAAVD